MSYSKYLKSNHWKKIRKRLYYDRCIHKCYLCRSEDELNIHHMTYVTKKGKSILYHEADAHLVVLCNKCHEILHKYFGTTRHKRKELDEIKRRFLKGRSIEQIDNAFKNYLAAHSWRNTQILSNKPGTPEFEVVKKKKLLKKHGTFNYYRLLREGKI